MRRRARVGMSSKLRSKYLGGPEGVNFHTSHEWHAFRHEVFTDGTTRRGFCGR